MPLSRAGGPAVLNRILRPLLFVYLVLIQCPIRFGFPDWTIDGSWIFGVNLAAFRSRAYGEDFAWITGPLGYLAWPMNLGSQLLPGLLFQFSLWTILAACTYVLVFRERRPAGNLLILAGSLTAAQKLFHYNYMGLEYLLLVPFYCLLIWALSVRRCQIILALLAAVVGGILSLIKISGFVIVGGTLVVFTLLAMRADWRKGLAAGMAAFGALLATVLAVFAILYGRVSPVVGFGKCLYEITRSFPVAWSLGGKLSEVIAAGWVWLLWIGLIAVMARGRVSLTGRALLFLPGLFGAFKHSFVRQDSHIVLFFHFAILSLGLIFLFEEMDANRWRRTWPFGLALLVLWSTATWEYDPDQRFLPWRAVRQHAASLGAALRPAALARELDRQSHSQLAAVRIPTDMEQRIGAASVASPSTFSAYLWETCPGLVPLPLLASYQSFTPYLDGLNEDWLGTRGPRFIVLEWSPVDQRNPLADAPLTLRALRRWYRTARLEPGHLLLERRAEERPHRAEPVASAPLEARRTLPVPTAPLLEAALDFRLNAAGQAARLLWRVPPIYLVIGRQSQKRSRFRVMPEVVANAFPLDQLPFDLAEAACFFQDECRLPDRVVSLGLEGSGLRYFDLPVRVHFYRTTAE